MFVIISGPTCSGKTSLVEKLKENGFKQIKTTTTRPRREGESLTAYNFVAADEFEQMIEKNRLLESNQHGDYMYGVEMREVVQAIDSGENYALVLEPSGHNKAKKYLQANNVSMLSVFVNANAKVRLARLMNRETDADELTERLATMLSIEAHWMRDELDNYDMLLETDSSSVDDIARAVLKHVTARNSLSKARVA